jgi:hypothetical protein
MRFQIPSHVRPIEDDSGVLLADVRQGSYFSLNGVGAIVWKALAEDATLDEAAARLTREFNVSHDVAADDVRSFVRNLRSLGLLDERPATD